MSAPTNTTPVDGVRRLAHDLRCVSLRTPTLPPATHTNAYVIGADAAIWVEPASCHADEVARALETMEQLERSGMHFEAYFLTHHHADHVGGLAAMLEARPLEVWAHPLTHERVMAHTQYARVDILEGALPHAFSSWMALHTPGHAPGHLCLFEKRAGRLIAGDMVADVGTILIDPADGDMSVYLESLARLSSLRAQVVYPAHGQPISAERKVFEQYIHHRLARERKVLDALTRVPQSLRELLPDSYGDTPRQLWPLAERSLLAHLEKLSNDGRAVRQGLGWRLSGEL